MTKYRFNKLIRSKLTDIMENAGVSVFKQELSDGEYYKSLIDKLKEETKEVAGAQDNDELIEELADVLTVIDAICEIKNIDHSEIEQSKKLKLDKKGDFSNRFKIDYVEYDEKDEKFKKYNDYYLADPKKYPNIDIENIDDSTILRLDDNIDTEIDKLIGKNLRKYNESRIGPYSSRKFFTVFIKKNLEIIAAAKCYIFGKLCKIELLWVDEIYRNSGLGSKIIKKIEIYAKEKNCKAIELDTASFQAKDFYIKLGFELKAILDESFLEYTMYILRKNL